MDFRIVDISEGGVQVETRLGLPPATTCELKISAYGSEMNFKAEVRRCRAQLSKSDSGCKVVYRSGLEFVEMDEDQLSSVRQIIASYCPIDQAGEDSMSVTQGAVVSGSLYTV